MKCRLARFHHPPPAPPGKRLVSVQVGGFLVWINDADPTPPPADAVAFGAKDHIPSELRQRLIVGTPYLHEGGLTAIPVDDLDLLDIRRTIDEPLDFLEWFAQGGEPEPEGGTP